MVSNIKPPDPPPRPPLSSTGHAAPAAGTASKEHAIAMPSTSAGVHLPSAPSTAHHKTLEFITEAAQELYAHGQLHIRPYAGYLKKERQHAMPSKVEETIMQEHQSCSKHTLSYYLDTYSKLAVLLITKITHILTHSFKISNDNNFQFSGLFWAVVQMEMLQLL